MEKHDQPLNVTEYLMTKDMKKAEALYVFFASISTGMTEFQECQTPETSEIDWSTDDLSSVEKEQVREHLNKLNNLFHGS